MIKNLIEYFNPEYEYYLDSVSYARIDQPDAEAARSLKCTDSIRVDAQPDRVRLTLLRQLRFEPAGLFELSISFGAVLYYDEDRKGEVEWDKVNLAEEFKENGGPIMSNLSSRVALLIAQITSSFGQQPLIMPDVMPRGGAV